MSTEVLDLAAPPRQRSRSLVFGGTFVVLAVLTACIALIPHMAIIALSAIYMGAFLGYLGLRTDPQGGYIFEVIIPIGVLTFLYFCLGTLYLVIRPEALSSPALAPYLVPAQALATLGFLCFLVGYGWFFRKTAPSPVGRFLPKSVLVYLIPAAMGALGMGVQQLQSVGMMNDQGISASLSFLQQFGPLFFFGWFLAWHMVWAKRLRASTAVPLLVALSVLAALVLFYTLGSKALAATLLGMPALAYYEVKRKLPMKAIGALVLLFVFVIFPIYNTYRRVDRNLDTSRKVDRTMQQWRSWDSEKYLDVSLFAFLKRITIVTSVAAIVSDTGRWVDYKYGETLVLAPIAVLIPRFLWPEKPNISIGQEFGSTFRLTNVLDRETYIAPSMVGDFYWNFALPGVVVGMWLLGMGYRWYYQRYGAGSRFDPIRKAIYFTLLPTALAFEGNVAIAIGGFIKVLVILVFFLFLCRRLGWLEDSPVL